MLYGMSSNHPQTAGKRDLPMQIVRESAAEYFSASQDVKVQGWDFQSIQSIGLLGLVFDPGLSATSFRGHLGYLAGGWSALCHRRWIGLWIAMGLLCTANHWQIPQCL